ncbi:MAG TPA: heme o synthase [Polyangiaceae bacterium]|nr:heme o synthase [Polyangiaceae bacterium]
MTAPALGVFEPKPISAIALSDLVALAKPRITALVITTTAGGLWLAPVKIGALTIALTLVGTVFIVAGANALNMYLERAVDARMDRTRDRPLPAGRLSPKVALWFGVLVSVIAVPILAIGVNAVTALLAVLANLSYVLAYTPLKQRSHHALLVGAVPGAMPPLLGWTAATGQIGAGGLVLFAILFLWQVPHFLAISIFRRDDYARAGLLVMPNVVGVRATKHGIVRYLFALVAVSLLLVPLGVEGRGYLVGAGVLGIAFFGWGCYGLAEGAGNRWARSLFAVSIVYLVLLFCALVTQAR